MRPFDNAAALALGGASVACPNTTAGLSNPAVLGLGQPLTLGAGSALPYGIGGWKMAYFQGFTRLSANDGLGLEATYSAIEVYGEQRYRLQYGRRLGAKFLMGAHADVLHVTAREYGSASGLTFGLGFLANPLPGVWLAATVQNPLQTEIAEEPVPAILRIGAAWQASAAFTVLAEVEKDLDRTAQVKAGLEYRPKDLFVFRLGVRNEPSRLAFGAGLRLKNGLRIDTGAEWHLVLGLTPAVMLGYEL